MRIVATAVLGVMLVVAAALVAGEDPGTKQETVKRPTGSWVRTDGDLKVRFDVKPHTILVTVNKGDEVVKVGADYAVTKDGYLFARINKVEKKKGSGEGPEEGMLFGFHYDLKADTMMVRDFQGPSGSEARQIVEGDYKGVASK